MEFYPSALLFLLPTIFALVISYITTPITVKIYKKLGWLDDPKEKDIRDTHTYPVPRGGGIPIFIAIAITSLIFIPWDQHMIGILLAALVATIVGILDDKYDLNPYFRLFFNFFSAGIVIGAGIGIAYISNPFGGIIDLSGWKLNFEFFGETRSLWILADIFAILWISWCMNFIGWSGGVEGQLPGFVAIAAASIGIIGLKYSADITSWPSIILAGGVSGAYLGFLPWNFNKQKIMPGYGGKSLAGLLLGTLSILSTAKVGALMLVLGIPLFDAIFSISRRVLSGHSPFWGDRKHLHHQLLDIGWSKQKVAIFYWIVTAILGLAAYYLNSKQKLYTIIGVSAIVGGILLWLNYFGTWRDRRDQDKPSKT